MTKTPRVTEVIWFEHVRKGGKPRVFKGPFTGVPGDSVFAEVKVQGVKFAVSCVSCGNEGVEPEQFELALRSAVAALCEACGVGQVESGVEVVPESSIN
jgi:hypothetical protein